MALGLVSDREIDPSPQSDWGAVTTFEVVERVTLLLGAGTIGGQSVYRVTLCVGSVTLLFRLRSGLASLHLLTEA
jgi:hypothetical protein